jgi:hypothetical protein
MMSAFLMWMKGLLPSALGFAAKLGKRLSGKLFTWHDARRIRAVQRAVESDAVVDLLARLYPQHAVLERLGWRYPVVVFPAPPSQRDPDSVLGTLDLHTALGSCPTRDKTCFALRERHLPPASGSKGGVLGYRMLQVHTRPTLQVDCGKGTFFETYTTCDSLLWELQHVGWQGLNDLPLRAGLHRVVSDPITDGGYRCAGIGISTLVVFKLNGRYQALLYQRPKRWGWYSNRWHVVPSCMFEAYHDPRREYSVRLNILREYLEELFNYDISKGDFPFTRDVIEQDRHIKRLRHLEECGRAVLELIGVAVDLHNLRPEILTLLLIQEEQWYLSYNQQKAFKFNWEFGQGARLIPLDADESELDPEVVGPAALVPPGAAAFWLGIEAARRKLGLASTV